MRSPATPPPIALLRDPRHLLAFGLGSGYAPRAPGTFGTLAALPLWPLFAPLPPLIYLLLLLLLTLIGIHLCGRTAAALDSHDHPAIVFDEWVGLYATLWLLPSGWHWVVLGVVLFRLFDILKPWPIRWIDRHVAGGVGIMLDDLLAALMAWFGVQGIALLSGQPLPLVSFVSA